MRVATRIETTQKIHIFIRNKKNFRHFNLVEF